MAKTIPPEIHDYVIDFLHDNPEALKTCSLVSRAWIPTSQYHIFRHILLHRPRPGQASGCCRLSEVLDQAFHLASYVTKVSVFETNPREGHSWVGRDGHLPILLKKLSKLCKLEILIHPTNWNEGTRWPADTIPTFSNPISSTSLRELSIRKLFFVHPVDLLLVILSCPSLTEFALDDPQFPSSVESMTPTTVYRDHKSFFEGIKDKIQLTILYLGAEVSSLMAGCLIHPLSPINLTTICHLTLQIPDHFSTYALLLQNMPSLVHLELQMMPRGTFVVYVTSGMTKYDGLTVNFDRHWSSSNPIDLGHNPLLEILILEFRIMLDRHDPLPWLHSLFSTVQPHNCLSEICLVSTIDMPPPYLTIPVYERSLFGWRRIDRLLTSETFTALQRLRLDFEIDNPIEDQIVPQIVQDFRLQLCALDTAGVLEVDTCEIR